MTLDPLQSLFSAILLLLIGGAVNRRIGVLSKYNIPDPITGGLMFAAMASALHIVRDFQFTIDANLKSSLLLIFFAGVGMTANLRLLKEGGKALLIFLITLFPFVILQNLAGLAVATSLDMHPIYGLVAGSITLVGGHGTGAAYAGRFAEVHNLQSIMELSMTSATIGLILGGIIAGPVAQYLISRNHLRSSVSIEQDANAPAATPAMTVAGAMTALAGILAAVIGGQWLAHHFADLPMTIPGFLWCMVLGVAIRNFGPFVRLHFEDRASELLGGICLSLFLVMTMMALNLIAVALAAGPLLVILAAQVVVIVLYSIWVCFRAMGRDYEAAVSSAAFIGFNMGSTATAIATMQAVTAKYGPAPKSFLIVPLAGAFFVDLMNAVVLTVFLSLAFIGG